MPLQRRSRPVNAWSSGVDPPVSLHLDDISRPWYPTRWSLGYSRRHEEEHSDRDERHESHLGSSLFHAKLRVIETATRVRRMSCLPRSILRNKARACAGRGSRLARESGFVANDSCETSSFDSWCYVSSRPAREVVDFRWMVRRP